VRYVAPIVLVAAAVLAAASVSHAAARHLVAWSKAQAETRVMRTPPRRWTKRGWTVAAAVCDGLGSPTLAPDRRARTKPPRLVRLFPNFSCEITVVRPTRMCPSLGTYMCVAGWESTAEERTLHVLGRARYALYRVPK
jgi:hypothetical protein